MQVDGQVKGARRRRGLRAAAAGIAAALALGAAALTTGAASADTGVEAAGAGSTYRVGGDIPNPGPGFRVKFAYRVEEGTQTYACDAATSTWATTSTPEAKLDNYGFRPPIHHFGGPRWAAKDGSTLLGTVVTKVPKDGTIPWLLLSVQVEKPGRQLGDITHISRVHTRGGVGPTGACEVGDTQAVPYGADYLFWTRR